MVDKIDLTPIRGSIVDDPSKAHGIAWAALNAGEKLQKVYIQHPTLKDDDVRIRVTYAGICQTDVSCVEGYLGPFITFPCIPGHEVVGNIVKVGSKVTNLKVGDLVGLGPMRDCCENCEYCQQEHENLCVGGTPSLTVNFFGSFSTSVQVPHRFVFKLPDKMQEDVCAPLMCAGCTVFAPLKKYGKKDGNAAILGIGGLGHLAVQISNKMGMKTYAVSTSDGKKEVITKLGAHEYINFTKEEDVKKLHDGKIDVMLNTTSNGDVTNYMRGLRRGGGCLAQIGFPKNEFKVSALEILMNEWRLAGSATSSRKDFREMLEFCNEKGINPKNEYFEFEDYQAAYDRVKSGKPEFRVVVKMKNVDTSICKAE